VNIHAFSRSLQTLFFYVRFEVIVLSHVDVDLWIVMH
jgi:hypothetical protein